MRMLNKLDRRDKIIASLLCLVILAVGFYAGYEYRTQEIKKAVNEAFSQPDTNSDNTDSSNSASTSKDDGKDGHETNYHKPGDVITYSTMTMKFNSARSATSITAEYGSPLVAEKDTKFIIVDHTVTNTGNSPFMYKELLLFDKEGRRYNASGDAIGYINNYLNVRELAPGVAETGVLVYVVPSSTSEFEFGGLNAASGKIDVVKFTVK